MDIDLRSFTEEGLRKFEKFLGDVKSGMPADGRDALLRHDEAEVVSGKICVYPQKFESRLAAGKYFLEVFSGVAEARLGVGVWAWLSLYFFDSVCPPNAKGQRVVGDVARYIPDPSNFQRYYRHLLYGPFSICRHYRGDPGIAMAVLCSPVDQPGDVVESLASRHEMITCPTIMDAATYLYVNKQGKHRRGAASKANGSARRLAAVLRQLDVTYDFFDMSAQDLLDMLPEEFDLFRTATD